MTAVTRWAPPPCGFVKCNVDAAVFDEEGKVGYDFIVRDCEGNMIMARNRCKRGPKDAFMVEAMGRDDKIRGFLGDPLAGTGIG